MQEAIRSQKNKQHTLLAIVSSSVGLPLPETASLNWCDAQGRLVVAKEAQETLIIYGIPLVILLQVLKCI